MEGLAARGKPPVGLRRESGRQYRTPNWSRWNRPTDPDMPAYLGTISRSLFRPMTAAEQTVVLSGCTKKKRGSSMVAKISPPLISARPERNLADLAHD